MAVHFCPIFTRCVDSSVAPSSMYMCGVLTASGGVVGIWGAGDNNKGNGKKKNINNGNKDDTKFALPETHYFCEPPPS